MLNIARELNNSETAFLFQPDDSLCDGVIRYFTPTKEVPTCGHTTIAAMYAKALDERLGTCTLNYKTKIGVLPFGIVKNEKDYEVTMTQGDFKLSVPLNSEIKQAILNAINLKNSDLGDRCPIQVASTGHSKVIIGIKSRETLNKLQPNLDELSSLSKQIGCNGYFVFTFDSENENILSYGRMFAPAIGIKEAPVKGN